MWLRTTCPYTEILTADYIMANPYCGESLWGFGKVFSDPEDPREFRPSKNYKILSRKAKGTRLNTIPSFRQNAFAQSRAL